MDLFGSKLEIKLKIVRFEKIINNGGGGGEGGGFCNPPPLYPCILGLIIKHKLDFLLENQQEHMI